MRNSMEAIDSGDIKEIKNISGRKSIRDNYEEEASSRNKVIKDRSISEPPNTHFSTIYMNNYNNHNSRLKTIKERDDLMNNQQGSSEDGNDDFEDFSKSNNSQLNDDSDSDLDVSASVSHTPTPTLLTAKSRRIHSETNLNDSKRRLTGFLGNRSKRFCASTSELNFASHLDTHKSLFSPRNNQTSRSNSLYGSNLSLNSTNSRLFMVNSPFYNGKTMFGGASSYPKRDINQHKVLRTPIQMRPSSSLSNTSNTSTKSEGGIAPESNAAKRILEILSNCSGPLKEARSIGNTINSMIKIPGLVQNQKRYSDENLQLDRSISLTRPTAPYSRPLVTSSKNQQPESPSISLNNSKILQIPTMSQLLKMKRLQNNTKKVREIANRSENFLNQVHEYKLPTQNDDKQSNLNNNNNSIKTNVHSSTTSFKMKSNITKNLLRNEKAIDELPPTPLNLPNVQLPELKSIPKFDIKLPSTSSVNEYNKMNTAAAPKAITSDKTASSQPNKSDFSIKLNNAENCFIFSTPICFNVNEADAWNLKITTDSFKFSKPIFIDETVEKVADVQSKAPVEDNLFKNLVAKQKSSTWECDSCLTRNDVDRTKCLCCDTAKRDSGIDLQLSTTSSQSKDVSAPATDDLFKKIAAQQTKSNWECSMCMTKNDLDKEKCSCCEAPKPGSKPKTAKISDLTDGMSTSTTNNNKNIASDDLFKSLVAQQKKSRWECGACMTSNEVSSDKCLCCESPKPGSEKSTKSQNNSLISSSASSITPKFSFGMPAALPKEKSVDPLFKKIVEKQSSTWECSACMTPNDQSQSKCICCEQAKPSKNQPSFSFKNQISSSIALPAPSEVKFSFGVQPSAVEPKVNSESTVTSKSSLSTSLFSAPSSNNLAFVTASTLNSTTGFKFGINSPKEDVKTTTDEKKEDEKEKSVAEIKIAAPAIEASSLNPPASARNGGFSFGAVKTPETTKVDDKSTAPVGISLFSAKPAEQPSTTSSEISKPASTFTFGSQTQDSSNPQKPVIFGSLTNLTKTTETADKQSPSIFGSFRNTTQTSTQFGVTASTSAPSIFKQSSSTFAANASSPTNTIFGSNLNSSTTPNTAPVFGSSTFNNSTPAFGSNLSSSTNNNNESGFGGNKMVGFRNIQSSTLGANQPQKRSLDTTSTDAPQKKFDFGTQQPIQPSNSTPFSFNAQPEAIKPAFQFSAPAAPQTFNFTANNNNSNNISNNQENLFKFGANNTSSQGILGANTQNVAPMMQFGATNTPAIQSVSPLMQFGAQPTIQTQNAASLMQFGANSSPLVAIQGINSFDAQSANTQPRKFLKAARRTNRR